MIIANTADTSPAIIMSTFMNNNTSTKISGMMVRIAWNPVGVTISVTSSAKTPANATPNIKKSDSTPVISHLLLLKTFICIPPYGYSP